MYADDYFLLHHQIRAFGVPGDDHDGDGEQEERRTSRGKRERRRT